MNSWTKALQMAGMSSIQTSQSQKALLRHLESLPHPNSESLRTDSISKFLSLTSCWLVIASA